MRYLWLKKLYTLIKIKNKKFYKKYAFITVLVVDPPDNARARDNSVTYT